MTTARMLGIAAALGLATVGGMAGRARPVAIGGATFAEGVDTAGPVVTSLRSGGAAERAGLHVGDVVDRLDARPQPGAGALAAAVRSGGGALLHVRQRGDARARTLLVTSTGGGA